MSKNTKFLIGLFIGLFLAGGIVILAAPVGTVLRSVLPETDNTYYLGTTSPRTYYANIYTRILTVSSGTATTTLNAGDSLATFAYPFTGISSTLNATSSGLRMASSSVLGVLNIGTLTATSGTSYLQALTLGTKLANAELANSSVTLNTTSPLGGGGSVSLGGTLTFTCSTCAIGTINSGTANRIAIYTGATTLDSSNLINNLGQGSTTIPSNLTVTSIYASSTARITGALTLDTALTVANGGTGATTFTSNGVLYGNGTGVLSITGQGSNNTVLTANAGAPSFSTSPILTNLTTTGSSTVFTNLTVAAIYASSTLRVTGAVTLDTALTVANGGTGATSFTSNGVLYGNGTGVLSVTAQGAANTVLLGNAGAPSFGSVPNAALTNSSLTVSGTGGIVGSGCSPVSLGGTCTLFAPSAGFVQFGGFNNATSSNLMMASSTVSGLLTIGYLNATTTTISTFAGPVSISGSTTVQALNAISATTTKIDILGSFATRFASTSGATNYTIDWSAGSIQRIILGANSIIAINATSSNPQNGGRYGLKICQDSVGSRTVIWSTPGQLRWQGIGNATTSIGTGPDTTAFYCIYIGMVYDGLNSIYDVLGSSTPYLSQ